MRPDCMHRSKIATLSQYEWQVLSINIAELVEVFEF